MSLALDLTEDIALLLDDPDFGRTVTLEQQPKGTYNPATGGATMPAKQPYTTRALLLAYKDSLIVGGLVRASDRKCILKVKGLPVAPDEGDVIIAGTDRYTVVTFKTGELGGEIYLYVLQIRKL